jgi:hypothetical protein
MNKEGLRGLLADLVFTGGRLTFPIAPPNHRGIGREAAEEGHKSRQRDQFTHLGNMRSNRLVFGADHSRIFGRHCHLPFTFFTGSLFLTRAGSLLCPGERTSSGCLGMSVSCRFRKSALLFDRLVGKRKHSWGNLNTQ